MPSFTVYAYWHSTTDDPNALLETFAHVLEPTDTDRCVWVDERRPAVVQMSFDIDAEDYEPAIEQARLLLSEGAAVNGFPGVLSEVVAMTEEGQLRWSAP